MMNIISFAPSTPTSKVDSWKNIPPEFRSIPQWMPAGPDLKGKFKAPHDRNGKMADSTNPANHMSYDEAVQVAAARPGWGIGFVLTKLDPYTFIDLDVKDCENAPDKEDEWTTEEELARYKQIIEAFDSFTERSSSGKGFHIFVRGDIGDGCRRDGVEVYSHSRFAVFTGRTLIDRPVAARNDLLDQLVKEIREFQKYEKIELVEEEEERSDAEIVERLMNQQNADKFNALCCATSCHYEHGEKFDGSYKDMGYPSQSEADLALMSMFCFQSRSNEQCRRLFRMTGLGKREKATRNNKYLDTTLRLIRGRQLEESSRTQSLKNGANNFLINTDAISSSLLPESGVDDVDILPPPRLRREALYGILGEIADAGSENTEAVPAALAINILTRFCALIGRRPHVAIGDEIRSLRIWAQIIGPTSKGRKGTSAQLPARIFEAVENNLLEYLVLPGPLRCETAVSSGQGLVWMVRDPNPLQKDDGVTDKRVLLEISEFSGVLAQAKQDTSVLTATLRDAFDGRILTTPNKNSPCRSTGAHFIAIGHITPEELATLMTINDISNGFANRFMMVYSARTKRVYEPAPTPSNVIEDFATRISRAVFFSLKNSESPIQKSAAAKKTLREILDVLDSRVRPPVIANLMARSETYLWTLSAAIALINNEHTVEPVHLISALAWIDFWEETANFCFTQVAQQKKIALLKALGDEIVTAIGELGGEDVRHSKLVDKLGKRKGLDAKILSEAIKLLLRDAPPRIEMRQVQGKGRYAMAYSLGTVK